VKVGGGAVKKFFGRAPPLFGSNSTIKLVVLVSAFVMVSTVWSVSCLLFYSQCPPCPAICRSGGHVLPVPHGVGATGDGLVYKQFVVAQKRHF